MKNAERNGKNKKTVGQILGAICVCLICAFGIAVCVGLAFKGQEVVLVKYDISNPYIANTGIFRSEQIMGEVKSEDGSYELKNLGTPKIFYDLSETETPYLILNGNALNNSVEDELHLPCSYRLTKKKE